MSNARCFKMWAIIAIAALTGCHTDEQFPSTSEIPEGRDVSSAQPNFTKQYKLNGGPIIAIYKDANAWLLNENSNEVFLQQQLGMLPGTDYLVLPMADLAAGVPQGVFFVILESNSWGHAPTDSLERNAASQIALDQFLQIGGTVLAHVAQPFLPSDRGYRVPGMTGPRVKQGSDRYLTIAAPADHRFRAGFDGVFNTADDLTDSNIDFTPISCCAWEGHLEGVLPDNAVALLENSDGKPVMAEYIRGLGRVIVTTVTVEYGVPPIYGQRAVLRNGYLQYALEIPDNDRDGVPVFHDCDDTDATLGRRLYEDPFDRDTGYFATTPQLYDRFGDSWIWDNGVMMTTGPSQQALIGKPETWRDLRVKATMTSLGTAGGCDTCNAFDTNRYRIGVLLRASLNPVADEGFQGYRCALSSNVAEIGGIPNSPGPSTGYFLQIASFDNIDFEDDIQSECEGGPNTSFTQLARSEHNILDIANGDTAEITLWADGNLLYCEARNTAGGPPVIASVDLGSDPQFTEGTIGVSTLNMLGVYDSIQACELNPTAPSSP